MHCLGRTKQVLEGPGFVGTDLAGSELKLQVLLGLATLCSQHTLTLLSGPEEGAW